MAVTSPPITTVASGFWTERAVALAEKSLADYRRYSLDSISIVGLHEGATEHSRPKARARIRQIDARTRRTGFADPRF